MSDICVFFIEQFKETKKEKKRHITPSTSTYDNLFNVKQQEVFIKETDQSYQNFNDSKINL